MQGRARETGSAWIVEKGGEEWGTGEAVGGARSGKAFSDSQAWKCYSMASSDAAMVLELVGMEYDDEWADHSTKPVSVICDAVAA